MVPQFYQNATVFFSEIYDFIDISITSTPSEIFTFLNDIFQSFDKIIAAYDSYKVETVC